MEGDEGDFCCVVDFVLRACKSSSEVNKLDPSDWKL